MRTDDTGGAGPAAAAAAPSAAQLPELSVSGGVDGVRARYSDISALGEVYAALGPALLGQAYDDKAEAADGDLVASAILSPATFAAAEQAILAATYGPAGLIARGAAIEAQALAFSAVIELYDAADAARRAASDALSYQVGYVVGYTLPVTAVGGAALAVGAMAATHTPYVGDDARRGLARLRGYGISTLEDHPEILQTLVNGGGGLIDGVATCPVTGPVGTLAMSVLGLGAFHPNTQSAADALGDLLYTDYAGTLNDDYGGPFLAHETPRGVGDLLGNLRDAAASDVPDGVFTIQEIRGADGVTRWVVNLPGTDSFTSDSTVRNMGSNLDLQSGQHTAYADAVTQAMEAAGVGADDPVMLVGHSQGGMQAAALAADPQLGYSVRDVVTAGSPIALNDIPDDVNVLSLENTGDVVPGLDGENNPDRPAWTTITADVHTGSLGAADGQNHAMSTYVAMGEAVDASTDPSVIGSVSSMQQFFEGEQVSVNTFQAELGDAVKDPVLGLLG